MKKRLNFSVPHFETEFDHYKTRQFIAKELTDRLGCGEKTQKDLAHESYRDLFMSSSNSASAYISNAKAGRGTQNGDELSKFYLFTHEEIRRVSVLFHYLSIPEGHPIIKKLREDFGRHFEYPPKLIPLEDSLDSALL